MLLDFHSAHIATNSQWIIMWRSSKMAVDWKNQVGNEKRGKKGNSWQKRWRRMEIDSWFVRSRRDNEHFTELDNFIVVSKMTFCYSRKHLNQNSNLYNFSCQFWLHKWSIPIPECSISFRHVSLMHWLLQSWFYKVTTMLSCYFFNSFHLLVSFFTTSDSC